MCGGRVGYVWSYEVCVGVGVYVVCVCVCVRARACVCVRAYVCMLYVRTLTNLPKLKYM